MEFVVGQSEAAEQGDVHAGRSMGIALTEALLKILKCRAQLVSFAIHNTDVVKQC